jgi:hypothetical protein
VATHVLGAAETSKYLSCQLHVDFVALRSAPLSR